MPKPGRPDDLIPRALDIARELIAAEGGALRAVGISIGGPLDHLTGRVVNFPNLPGWIDVPLCAMISAGLGAPARLDNDANLGALAEHRWGAGRGVGSMVYLTLSTGIGGGVIVDAGSFDWAKGGKYPTLSEPNASYHGLKFTEAFGPLAFILAARTLGLRDLGPALAPMNAFLALTGMETLALRMDRHCANALALAKWLRAHPKVDWVSYAGLEDDPYHALAKRYLGGRGGAVFTFGLKGGYDAGVKLVSSVKLFSHLANLGDTRSLIIHPASTTHSQLSEADLIETGAGPDVVRVSVGIEHIDDIIADLAQALEAAA